MTDDTTQSAARIPHGRVECPECNGELRVVVASFKARGGFDSFGVNKAIVCDCVGVPLQTSLNNSDGSVRELPQQWEGLVNE